MSTKNSSLLILATVVLSSVIVALQFANADDAAKTEENGQLQGTYLIAIETETERLAQKVLVDPNVVELGSQQFLAGAASNGVSLVNEQFEGRTVYVPLSRVVMIQQVAPE